MIQNLAVSKLSNDVLLAYTVKVSRLLASTSSKTLKSLVDKLQMAVDGFSDALQNTPEMLAYEIQAKDTAVDEAWIGLNTELENNLDHPNAAKREASSKVYDVWSVYDDPTELPFDEEYSTIEKIISELSALDIDLLKRAAVDEWFDALKERYRSFIGLWGENSADDAQRIARQLKESRFMLENCYLDLVGWVNHEFCYEETDWSIDVSSQLNAEIDNINK